MSEWRRADGVCQCHLPGARWLVTGHGGGFREADAVYNATVPEGFERTDIDAYSHQRRTDADFDRPGPMLLTGVEMHHARIGTADSVAVLATVGLSNPAGLEMLPSKEINQEDEEWNPGTVNLIITHEGKMENGTITELLATCVEAKAATLTHLAGVPGTTSDAIAVGVSGRGEEQAFAGSATPVGSAARACVRDAIRASFRSRYGDTEGAPTVESAEHGVVTARQPLVETVPVGEMSR
jgi:adenosylcobinamide hydrolase